MDEQFQMWSSILERYGENTVYQLAKDADFDTSCFDGSVALDDIPMIFAELIDFVTGELAPIDEDNARELLLEAGIPEDQLDDLLF